VTIRYRPMEPRDVRECADIVAAHPVIGSRYGRQIGDLSKAWLRLLSCKAANTNVYQEGDASRAPICCVGVSLFVTDDFVREIKTPPLRWIGPELMQRILGGDSPVLSDRQLRESNSRGGLNLIVWKGCIRPGFETNIEIPRFIMSGFIEVHRGFLLKEVISSQLESVERLRWTFQTGGLLWNPMSVTYEKSSNKDPEEIIRNPHILGTSRKAELDNQDSWNATWVGSLFDYHPPRCGFRPSEQRLLLMALGGGTDDELSEELGVSIPTVKKMWLSIYRRVDQNLPELNPNHPQPDVEMTQRGKEKKRHLLIYLRKHPEELRPVSQKLLSKPSATDRPSSKRQSP
jgi:hypothetical protein